ncbi:hypothetical protein H0X06_00795 [Candidatus Dependentiae bacterium]|nr:hypothetical protein [Candidatus Dependentiae bacterium]
MEKAFLLHSTIPSQEQVETIPCFEKELTLIYSSHAAALINPGCLGRRLSASSFVEYTLIPTLRKKGITALDALISLQPSTMNFIALECLLEKIRVKKLYVSHWSGSPPNKGWSAWEKLRRVAHKYGTTVIIVCQTEEIVLGSKAVLLTPRHKLMKKNRFAFVPVDISY